ncbi:MAG: acyl-ACP--UDP-N-acetylglucosamine O-acyltransferase [Armatimonadetes bacterium]|nr:acyl-ACP--UDP-N-acetylglucosamine O-acyltransferase [Armatimonadota bacterium]
MSTTQPVLIDIHPTAQVHPDAVLGKNVRVGPYSVIGPHVTIGDGTRLGAHVVVDGWTRIGKDNEIYAGAVIGTEPQDFRYKGEEAWVHIGDRNIIREYATINRAFNHMGATIVGNENMLMAYTHVAHNCKLGNGIIMTNYVGFAGHVEVEDFVVFGGYAGVHQFVRVGTMAMVGGAAKVIKDIPPFSIVDGQPARIYEINSIGLKRRGVKSSVRTDLRRAYRLLTRSGMNLGEAIEAVREQVPDGAEVAHLIRFMETKSRMGVLIRMAEKNGNGRVLRGESEGDEE